MQKPTKIRSLPTLVMMLIGIITINTYGTTKSANDWEKLIEQQQFDRVLNTANAILNIDSNNQDALFYQALALYESEREDLATPYFNHLIDQYNQQTNQISLYRLALSHFYLGNNRQAAYLFDEVLHEPKPPIKAQVMRAYALAKDNQLQRAVKAFNQLIKQQPSHSLYYNRALVYLGLNKLDAAKSDLQKAIEAKSDFHLPYFDLISIHVLQENPQQALIWLEKLLGKRESNLARLQQDPILTDFINSEPYLALLKKYKIN